MRNGAATVQTEACIREYLALAMPRGGNAVSEQWYRGRAYVTTLAASSVNADRPRATLTLAQCADVIAFMGAAESPTTARGNKAASAQQGMTIVMAALEHNIREANSQGLLQAARDSVGGFIAGVLGGQVRSERIATLLDGFGAREARRAPSFG